MEEGSAAPNGMWPTELNSSVSDKSPLKSLQDFELPLLEPIIFQFRLNTYSSLGNHFSNFNISIQLQ